MGDRTQDPRRGVEELIIRRLNEHAAVIDELAKDRATVAEIAVIIARVLKSGGKVLIFGNGGSAADAQHFAAELVGRLYLERRAYPAIALSTNTSNLTAIGNDYGYDQVFARQVEALGSAGDVAVGISTSGNSASVVAGLEMARQLGLTLVVMTGRKASAASAISDVCLAIDTEDTPRCQEAHIAAIHIICEWVEMELIR